MPLRAAELEVLFTANTTDIAKAEKDVKSAGERIEKKPVEKKITANDKDALAGMDRVEKAAKKLVGQRTVAVIDADIDKAQKALTRTEQKLEELQARALGGLDVAADTRRAEAALQKTQRQLTALTAAREQIEVEADVSDAVAGIDQVDGAAKRLVSREIAVQVDANVKSAQANVTRLEAQLAQLAAMQPTTEVRADTYKAEALLDGARKKLQSLEGARAQMEVEVDTASAEQGLDAVADQAADAGKRGGEDAGSNLAEGIIAALVSIPIAGAVVGVAKAGADAILQAFEEGLQQEKSYDRLQGLTGISEQDALRFGRSASEAYANGFGESIESNMDIARLGLQLDIIDPEDTNRDAQSAVAGLAGIADVLEEDVQPVARATASLLATGLAKSSEEAFDIFAAGAREGVNRGEDLLDTLNEYSSTFASIGLTGGQTLGLLNQGLKAGAPNTDFFADSLRELGIRLREGDDATAGFVEQVGLVPSELQAAFTEGGPAASAALDQLFDKLNQIEDPILRNKVAVGLLGTQFEDLQFDVSKIDLSTAEAQMNGVEGAAQKMFDTLASNDASSIEVAQRNIEVAADGMKGALASAFSEPLGDLAEFVSENRGPLLQFMLDLANGALDFGESVVESAASGGEALGEFVAGPLRDTVIGLRDFLEWLPGDQDLTGLNTLIDDMDSFDESANAAADNLRGNMGGALEEARTKLNEFGEGAVAMGYLNDASLRLATAIDTVGYSADGSKLSLEGVDLANLSASESGAALEGQVRASIAALSDEVTAAAATGEAQEALTGRYNTATEALVGQLTQMGLTEGQARSLIDTVLKTPDSATTEFSSNAPEQQGKVQSLNDRIVTLEDGSVVVQADTSPAQSSIDRYVTLNDGRVITVTTVQKLVQSQAGAYSSTGLPAYAQQARGNILEFMAAGGLPGLTPMASLAQMVPASTWRVVGDRSDVPELYAPLDGSARSWALMMEGLRRMPGSPVGAGQGGVAAPVPSSAADSGPLRIVGTLDLGNGLTATIRGEIEDYDKRKQQTRAGDWK